VELIDDAPDMLIEQGANRDRPGRGKVSTFPGCGARRAVTVRKSDETFFQQQSRAAPPRSQMIAFALLEAFFLFERVMDGDVVRRFLFGSLDGFDVIWVDM